MLSDFDKKYMPYLMVVLVAVLSVVGVLVFVQPEKNEEELSKKLTQSETKNTMESSEPETKRKSKYAASDSETESVTRVMNAYFKARNEHDADTMNELTVNAEPFTSDDFQMEEQYIRKFDDVSLYIYKDQEYDYFIVYAKYMVYFRGITEGAPSLSRFVVRERDDGMRIWNKTWPDQVVNFVRDTEGAKEVRTLISEVNKDLKTATEKNADLKSLVELIEQ